MRSFVAGRVEDIPSSGIRVIFERANKIPGVIRMEVGEPDFDTPLPIRQAAKRSIDEGFTHYTSSAGILPLREAIATKLKTDNGVDADAATEVVVAPGAGAALYLSILCTTNNGDEVLIPDPGWPHYEACVKLAGGKPVRYPLREDLGFRPDFDAISRLVNRKTKTLIVNTPSNPVGSVLEKKDLEKMAELALANDLLVVSDEVYEKIVYDRVRHYSIASFSGMKERTLTINALSKTYAMTGWRLGYAAGPAQIMAQINKLNLYTSGCASSIAQKAAVAALSGPQDDARRMVREYAKRRNLILRRLNEIEGVSCSRPGGAFYAFPKVSIGGLNAFDTSMFLLENARVATVPGSAFGQLGENHVRFSYATSIDLIEEAMDRVASAVRDANGRKANRNAPKSLKTAA
ncbi:MAG: pyridoxal phosphate-dependent aminotransferase [Thaumarchaeota archaeon]|nr:pyridoxal phosphate-dependent aminotransferase [Nitrososphaerota archaeon]